MRFEYYVAIFLLFFVTAVLLLLGFILSFYLRIRTMEERFVGDDQAPLCFGCMPFFSEVFQTNNPDTILSYTKKRADEIDKILDELRRYFDTDEHGQCMQKTVGKGEFTIKDHIACFTNKVAAMEKACGTNIECKMVSTLGDQLLRKIMNFSGTVVFDRDMKANIAVMKADLQKCRVAFQKIDDPCVQQYRAVMETKKGKPSEPTDNRPVTRGTFDDKMGEMATWVMTMT